MKAFLHFGRGDQARLTIAAECKVSELPWQRAGLTYTATGYGNRIPSRYMVKLHGRWRRVYNCIFSNAGSLYIGAAKNWAATVSIEES